MKDKTNGEKTKKKGSVFRKILFVIGVFIVVAFIAAIFDTPDYSQLEQQAQTAKESDNPDKDIDESDDTKNDVEEPTDVSENDADDLYDKILEPGTLFLDIATDELTYYLRIDNMTDSQLEFSIYQQYLGEITGKDTFSFEKKNGQWVDALERFEEVTVKTYTVILKDSISDIYTAEFDSYNGDEIQSQLYNYDAPFVADENFANFVRDSLSNVGRTIRFNAKYLSYNEYHDCFILQKMSGGSAMFILVDADPNLTFFAYDNVLVAGEFLEVVEYGGQQCAHFSNISIDLQ